MKDWQFQIWFYSKNPTDQLLVADDHPKSSPDRDLTGVKVNRGRHKVLVKDILHIRIGVFLVSRYMLFYLTSFGRLNPTDPVQLLAKQLLRKQTCLPDLLQRNAFDLIFHIFLHLLHIFTYRLVYISIYAEIYIVCVDIFAHLCLMTTDKTGECVCHF